MADPKTPSGPRPGTSAPLGQEPDPSGSFPGAKGKALSIEGRITGDIPKVPSPAPLELEHAAEPEPDTSGLPKLEALTTSDLELVRDERPKPADYVDPGAYREERVRSRRGPGLWVALLVVLGVGAAAIFALQPDLARTLPTLPTERPTLSIRSEPDGAQVLIEGQPVGQTPYAADNLWGGTVRYELRLEGFAPATGTFKGGEKARVDAVLKKAP